MPEIGRPNLGRNTFNNVQMAPKEARGNQSPEDKQKLLNKLTGYKDKSVFVDGKKHNQMGKDEFLKLLTNQLQNQDPMKPMDQTKMTSELAQFSQLEQLANLNTKFDKMGGNAAMQDKFYGASFLGKEVVTNGSSLAFEGENTKADILFTLPNHAQKLQVKIFDNKNNIVGEIWKEGVSRGNQVIAWDGTGLDGSLQPEGDYRVLVKAWDNLGDPIDVKSKVKGQVESIYFENGETVLLVDGKKVFLRDVDSFHVPGKTKNMKLKEEKQQVSSALAGVRANPAPSRSTNLPTAQKNNNNVKLNQVNAGKAYNTQRQHVPSTGLTDVYDVE